MAAEQGHGLAPGLDPAQVTALAVERRPRRGAWRLLALAGGGLLLLYAVAIAVLLRRGPGVWGNNQAVNWGLPILHYIWWLGIGHAGTFISALLWLLRRPWRHSLSRLAELMTLMAVCCAGLYPILHLGRPWLFFWTFPYPDARGLWPQLKSPTAWDMFAVTGYLLLSLAFLYLGALGDFAAARDRAGGRGRQRCFGLLALGWRNSQRHWALWWRATRVLAVLAIAMVFGVSSGYSFLLALAPQPGWHSTLFPPYFVAGAVFSGFALVSLLALLVRGLLRLQALITPHHLDLLGRLLLASGWLTAYGYLPDLLLPLYGDDAHEHAVLLARLAGPGAWSYWLALACNLGVLQALWWRRVRRSPAALAGVAGAVLLGMWAERYMLLVVPQQRGYLAATWGAYAPTPWDALLFLGSFGLFLLPYALFIRWLPMVSAFELKQELQGGQP